MIDESASTAFRNLFTTARKRRKLSMHWAAVESGVDERAVAYMERRGPYERMTFFSLARYAAFYNISLDFISKLLGFTDEAAEPNASPTQPPWLAQYDALPTAQKEWFNEHAHVLLAGLATT